MIPNESESVTINKLNTIEMYHLHKKSYNTRTLISHDTFQKLHISYKRKPSESISVFIRLESFNPIEQDRDMHFLSTDKPIFHFLVSFKKHNKPLSTIYQFLSKNFLLCWAGHRWHGIPFNQFHPFTFVPHRYAFIIVICPSHPTSNPLPQKGQRTFINLEWKQEMYTFFCRLMRNKDWNGNIGNFRLLI